MPHRLLQDGKLVLYGPVGLLDIWNEEGFTANDVLAALTEVEGDLTVRLNSGGGFAFDGVAIFNALKAHDGRIRVEVDALAASAASVVAMAGDEIVMREGALMMIHNAAGLTFGTREDHAKTIEVLSRLDGQMAGLYARRSGQPRADVATLMAAETWMTGEEAVDRGFATETDDAVADEPTAFAYQIYAHAPERLVALAEKRHARPDDFRRQIAASLPGLGLGSKDRKETIMTTEPTPTPSPPAVPAASIAPAALTPAEQAEVSRMCLAAGVPAMVAPLLEKGVKPADAQARIDSAKDIKASVELARKTCPAIEASLADTFIAAGASLEAVRAELFTRMAAAASDEVNPRHDNSAATAGKGGQDSAAIAAGWAKAAAATNARFGRA